MTLTKHFQIITLDVKKKLSIYWQINQKKNLNSSPPPSSPGVFPIMAYAGRLCPKGVPYVTLQVYERPEISRFQVYEMVRKSVIRVFRISLTHIPYDGKEYYFQIEGIRKVYLFLPKNSI